MRRNISKVISVVLTMSLALSMCACSAKSSADTENTTAEAETEIETEEETEEETVDASGNDSSGNDVSDNDVSENDAEESTEEETEESPESKTNAASEEEEETESESTNSKTSEKDSTKSETTTSETTTEAVTVQSVSAVVSGTHYVGETLTGADFTVTVTMSDGTVLTNPEGWAASPLTLSSTSNVLTITYKGISTTLTVNAVVAETTAAASSSTSTASTGSGSGSSSSSSTATSATTAAETTAASGVEWVEWADGDWNYALARALFIAQNEMRAEAGVDALTWDDQTYEVAKQCAKVCGDNGVIDHDLTAQYRGTERITYNGETVRVSYGENLEISGSITLDVKTDDVSYYLDTGGGRYASEAELILVDIKNSAPHYKGAISSAFNYGAIAVYKMGETTYISYLFEYGDDI